jgi:hypothetical protein
VLANVKCFSVDILSQHPLSGEATASFRATIICSLLFASGDPSAKIGSFRNIATAKFVACGIYPCFSSADAGFATQAKLNAFFQISQNG